MFPEALERLLRLKLHCIELDKNLENYRKVDIFALADNKEVYMEVQLSSADNIHFSQLEKIIQSTKRNNYILVWLASDFSCDYMEKIYMTIKKSGKNIEFYAIRINENIRELDILNSLHPFKLMINLSMLHSVKEKLKIKESRYIEMEDGIITADNKDFNDIKAKENPKEELLGQVLEELRKEINWYAPIFKNKSVTSRVINIGSGKSDVSFGVGINRHNELFVHLRFNDNVNEMFETLLKSKDKIDSDFDFLTEWEVNFRKIVTYLYWDKKKQDVIIKRLVRITAKYIRYFLDFIIQYDKFKTNSFSNYISKNV